MQCAWPKICCSVRFGFGGAKVYRMVGSFIKVLTILTYVHGYRHLICDARTMALTTLLAIVSYMSRSSPSPCPGSSGLRLHYLDLRAITLFIFIFLSLIIDLIIQLIFLILLSTLTAKVRTLQRRSLPSCSPVTHAQLSSSNRRAFPRRDDHSRRTCASSEKKVGEVG